MLRLRRKWWCHNHTNQRLHGPFWTRDAAADVASRLNEDLMFKSEPSQWQAVHSSWLNYDRKSRL